MDVSCMFNKTYVIYIRKSTCEKCKFHAHFFLQHKVAQYLKLTENLRFGGVLHTCMIFDILYSWLILIL